MAKKKVGVAVSNHVIKTLVNAQLQGKVRVIKSINSARGLLFEKDFLLISFYQKLH